MNPCRPDRQPPEHLHRVCTNTTQTARLDMKQNVHNIERVVRVVIGLAIVSLVFIGPQSAWGWLGLIPVATGLTGWCPPYAMLGINTCKKPQ